MCVCSKLSPTILKYSFENSIPSTNIIDIDYSQANEVAICLGTEVKYYTHDGTTYTESAIIAETCNECGNQ